MNLYCGACQTTIPATEFTGACPGCGNGTMQETSEGKISYGLKSTLNVCASCGGLYSTNPNEGFAGTPCMCGAPPTSVVQALRNFVDGIYGYEETGTWPDNYTLRKWAEEGREALNGIGKGTPCSK